MSTHSRIFPVWTPKSLLAGLIFPLWTSAEPASFPAATVLQAAQPHQSTSQRAKSHLHFQSLLPGLHKVWDYFISLHSSTAPEQTGNKGSAGPELWSKPGTHGNKASAKTSTWALAAPKSTPALIRQTSALQIEPQRNNVEETCQVYHLPCTEMLLFLSCSRITRLAIGRAINCFKREARGQSAAGERCVRLLWITWSHLQPSKGMWDFLGTKSTTAHKQFPPSPWCSASAAFCSSPSPGDLQESTTETRHFCPAPPDKLNCLGHLQRVSVP